MSAVSATPGDFRSAFLINLASAAGGQGLRFAVSLVLARLMMPEDLGLVAICLALLGVAQVLRDLGVGAFLQREHTLSAERFASCLGVLWVATAALTVVLALAAGPLARHYGHAGLQPLMGLLLLGFALQPFSLVMSALQQRALAAAIARVSRLGELAHGLTAVALAALGCGAYSLAGAYLVNVAVCSAALWPLRPRQFSWRPSLQAWRPVLHFGHGALLNNVLVSLNGALPELLLGRLGSVSQVGLLGRAHAVANLFSTLSAQAANFGALRVFADLHHRKASLGPALQRATALLTGVGWPVLALVALFHQELVHVLYGPAWQACAEAVPPLAAAVALGLLSNYGNAALQATGRTHAAALPLMLSLAARAGLALLFFDGRLLVFAWCLLAATVVTLPLQLALASRHLDVSPAAWLGLALRSGWPCLACLASAALLHGRVPAALVLAAALVVWLLALRWGRHELVDESRHCLLRLRSTIRK